MYMDSELIFEIMGTSMGVLNTDSASEIRKLNLEN